MIKITPTISNMRNTRAATTPPAMAPTGTAGIVVHGYCKGRVTRYLALLTLLMNANGKLLITLLVGEKLCHVMQINE